jgi:hypothetical protein
VGGLLLLFMVAGCDSLLDVELPGQLEEPDLDDPTLAATLALGARGEFECSVSSWAWQDGLWTQQLHSTDVIRTRNIVAARLSVIRFLVGTDATFSDLACTSENPPPLWYPFHASRFVGEDAERRISGWLDDGEDLPRADFLRGKSLAYAGYSIQMQSEAFCEMVFDGGSLETREQGMERAVDRFTSALQYLGGVTGADAERAVELINMVHVGLARAHLNLGDDQGVLDHAAQVDEGFVALAERSGSTGRRWNRVFNLTSPVAQAVTADAGDLDLEVGGVPDPRIQIEETGIGNDGQTTHWTQLKYTSRADPIPFASWREAQLMVAEVEGGQTAVDIINMLRDTHELPHFSSTDEAEILATLIEERRRELYLTGTHLADQLRHPDLLPFPTGSTPQGEPYGSETCIPIPELEELGNPNL